MTDAQKLAEIRKLAQEPLGCGMCWTHLTGHTAAVLRRILRLSQPAPKKGRKR